MYKKIDVYVNGKYEFSTNKYRSCKELKNHIRAINHLSIAIPGGYRYLTVYDYDKLSVRYAN